MWLHIMKSFHFFYVIKQFTLVILSIHHFWTLNRCLDCRIEHVHFEHLQTKNTGWYVWMYFEYCVNDVVVRMRAGITSIHETFNDSSFHVGGKKILHTIVTRLHALAFSLVFDSETSATAFFDFMNEIKWMTKNEGRNKDSIHFQMVYEAYEYAMTAHSFR